MAACARDLWPSRAARQPRSATPWLFPPDGPTRPLPRHSARISPQRSKIKTAKPPNREGRRSSILPAVTLAVPCVISEENRRPKSQGRFRGKGEME